MRNFSIKTVAAVGVLLVAWLGTAGLAAAEGMAYRELPVAMTVTVDTRDAVSDTLGFDVKAGECVRVELYAASGTGYEWALVNKDLQLVDIVHQSVNPAGENPGLPGGKMQTVYVLQAKADASGCETVTFALRRAWEAADMAARTVVCKINIR